jgi:hypothetical protein
MSSTVLAIDHRSAWKVTLPDTIEAALRFLAPVVDRVNPFSSVPR